MALTIVVRSPRAREGDAPEPGSDAPENKADSLKELSITVDAPRVVLGRSESCDVLLPDPSVSPRHASIRQRGGEYLLVDEQSRNGTFIGKVKLSPQSPRVIVSGQKIRLGRVWLELIVEPKLVSGKAQEAAKELALELITQGLRAQGEDGRPKLLVTAGPDAGKQWVLEESGRRYVLGRARDVDFVLDDPNASRRQLSVMRKGDQVLVQDLSAKVPLFLDDKALGTAETAWKPGQALKVAGDRIVFEYPAKEALLEILRSPDEALRPGEIEELGEPVDDISPEESTPADLPSPEPARAEAIERRSPQKRAPASEGGFGLTDGAVFLLALGVLALSIAGMWLLWGQSHK